MRLPLCGAFDLELAIFDAGDCAFTAMYGCFGVDIPLVLLVVYSRVKPIWTKYNADHVLNQGKGLKFKT